MTTEPTSPAVHVAIGGVAGAALAEIAAPVLVENDNLLLGPSSADVTRHRALRARRWGRAPSIALEEELARATGPLLCVALPPTPSGLLSLGRICDRALALDRRVSVIELDPESPGALPAGIDPGRAVHLDEAALLRDRPPAVLWSKLQAAFAATLWRLWCRRSPVAFSRLCASGGAHNPQLATLARCHAGMFPRSSSQGLLVSRLDELILRQLSRAWLTPTQVFVNAAKSGSELDAWLSHTGDLYLTERLLAWSRHRGGRVVERRKGASEGSPAAREWAFRFRAGGEEILEALPSLEAAPQVAVGGAVAGDPDRPWVARVDAATGPYVVRAPSR